MKYLILLSGKINCGKNQYAKFLQESFESKGLKVKQDLYAGDLKNFSVEDFSILGEVLQDQVDRIKANVGAFFDSTDKMSIDVQKLIEDGLDGLTFHDHNFYEYKTPITRALLQLYGTNIARKRFDDHFWIKSIAKRITEDTENDVIIVTDVRFPNEVEDIHDYVKNRRIVPIRIEREIPRDNIAQQHVSETALDDYKFFEYIVDNNGTLEDLLGSSKVVTEDILVSD